MTDSKPQQKQKSPPEPVDPAAYRPAMDKIRRRRKYFFGLILIYMPAMWLCIQMKLTTDAILTIIAIWSVLVFIAALMAAVTYCPRCGNYFHVHGMTLMFLRKCLHCQLHINADRKKTIAPAKISTGVGTPETTP